MTMLSTNNSCTLTPAMLYLACQICTPLAKYVHTWTVLRTHMFAPVGLCRHLRLEECVSPLIPCHVRSLSCSFNKSCVLRLYGVAAEPSNPSQCPLDRPAGPTPASPSSDSGIPRMCARLSTLFRRHDPCLPWSNPRMPLEQTPAPPSHHVQAITCNTLPPAPTTPPRLRWPCRSIDLLRARTWQHTRCFSPHAGKTTPELVTASDTQIRNHTPCTLHPHAHSSRSLRSDPISSPIFPSHSPFMAATRSTLCR